MAEDDAPEFDPAILVERAIESVLDQVPDLPDMDVPETGTRMQPWADVAAPAGKNKRPLDELLSEFAERIAANPDAKAGHPDAPRPEEVFFEHLARSGRSGQAAGSSGGGSRRRRRRRGGGGEHPGTQAATAPGLSQPTNGRRTQGPPPTGPSGGAPGGPKRRRRRGRRGRGGGGTGGGTAGGGSNSGS